MFKHMIWTHVSNSILISKSDLFDRSIYGSWPFLSRQQVIFNLLTAERSQLILAKHVPHYVIMSELLFEIVLAVRDNISKHLKKIKSNSGAMSLFKYSSPSKSYLPFNFLLYQKSHLWSISKNALRQLFQENDLLLYHFYQLWPLLLQSANHDYIVKSTYYSYLK